jgi:recombination protein RecA
MVKEKTEEKQRLIKKLSELKKLDEVEATEFVPTGSYALNKVISGNYFDGIPIGGPTQLKGGNSTGKTLFAISILKEAQKLGYHCKMIDTENALNKEFAKKLGLDPNKIYYSAPETLEDTFDDIVMTINSIRAEDKTTPIVITLDSLAVLPCKKELERLEFENDPMDGAIRAKITGAGLKIVNTMLKRDRVALIIVNQIRSKVGVVYGNPDIIAAGGRSLEYYLHVDLETVSNKTSDILRDDNKAPIGIKGEIRCKKNKCSIPFRECGFEVLFDTGLNPYYGLLDFLVADGIVQKTSPGRYSIGETKFFEKDFISLLTDKNNQDTAIIRKLLKIEQ